jgi:MSHA biogenesis protein MshP
MSPKVTTNIKQNSNESGSALVIAIFIIVVMSLLGSALVRMNDSNTETIAYEVIGARAYQAAQAGSQLKLKEVFPLTSSTKSPECEDNINPYDFSGIKGLVNCKAVNVTCSDKTIDDVTYYTITSTGQCEVADVLTSRKIEVKARTL